MKRGQQDIAKSLAERKCSQADSSYPQDERISMSRESIRQVKVLLESYAVTSDGNKLRSRMGDRSERKVKLKVDDSQIDSMMLVKMPVMSGPEGGLRSRLSVLKGFLCVLLRKKKPVISSNFLTLSLYIESHSLTRNR